MASCARDAADPAVEVAVVVPASNLACSARWSPDGKRLAYERTVEGRSGIWVSNADGSNPVRLTNGVWDYLPIWSPDSKWVAYLAESPNFDVMVVSADGGRGINGEAFDDQEGSPTAWPYVSWECLRDLRRGLADGSAGPSSRRMERRGANR
jgi:Tol biopolymer transport system component